MFQLTPGRFLLAALVIFTSNTGKPAAQNKPLYSPDHQIKLMLSQQKGSWLLTAFLAQQKVMSVEADGLVFQGESDNSLSAFHIQSTEDKTINERYALNTGKTSRYHNFARQRTVRLVSRSGKQVDLIIRAYNDGIAFRYVYHNKDTGLVTKEHTRFVFPKGTQTWAMEYKDDFENYYQRRHMDSMKAPIYNMPLLAETPSHQWMLLHEADVLGRSIASALTGNNGEDGLHITWDFPKLAMKDAYKGRFEELLAKETYQLKASPRFATPWRMIIIGNQLKQIVQSTMTENLAPPAQLTSAGKFQPGVAVFPWWANHNANQDTNALKTYVDCAAAMGWDVMEFDVSLIGSPDLAVDKWLTTPWIKNVTDYAHSKKIKVYGWDERRNLDTKEKRATIFGKYKELGVEGIKIDFINSVSQEACQFRYDCLTDAAKFGLMVSFHGDYSPRGERRTFPNLMTNEGVLGAEQYWNGNPKPPTALHNLSLAFTRNVIGPMDYTPTVYSSPLRTTTYAHETACAFIFESGWVCMADAPELFLQSPAREILHQLEASWDETLFLAGHPDQFVVLARRKGTKWIIAGLNNGTARTVNIPLNFLKNKGLATICSDDAGYPRDKVKIKKQTVSAGSKLQLTMQSNGGFVVCVQ